MWAQLPSKFMTSQLCNICVPTILYDFSENKMHITACNDHTYIYIYKYIIDPLKSIVRFINNTTI